MNEMYNYLPMILIKKDTSVYDKVKYYFEEKKSEFHYYLTDKNEEFYINNEKEFSENEKLMILICDKNEKNELEVNYLYWCSYEIKISETTHTVYLSCSILYESDSKVVIKNACNNGLIDVAEDFNDSYIKIEFMPDIYSQFTPLEKDNNPFECDKIETIEYKPIETEIHLDKLAQRNEYCKREKYISKPSPDGRGEFQRDYDRIVYSKSFRRMADKTQIFSASKGDYYRTRMTHTMIVCQIARSICNALDLNCALTEAIAVGHDLGHTPFGHVGERTLNKKCQDIGGFKHNYQGVRAVSILENQYIGAEGLDLSFQVLEGIFKHTKQVEEVDIVEIVNNNDTIINNLYLDYKHSITLEGQIVSLADEIAQRSHDIDDALTSKLLSIDELLNFLKLSKFEKLNKKITELNDQINKINEMKFIDKNELFFTRISSEIVKYFIQDVINESKGKIVEYTNSKLAEFETSHIITEKLITFSKEGNEICKNLEKILTNKILNSTEVSLADENSEKIINTLFDTYYANPQLLHTGTKRALYIDFIKNMKAGGDIYNIIDISNANPKAIRDEFAEITDEERQESEIVEKRKLLKRKICDYIAGMTDQYAIREYNNVCKLIVNI